MRYMILSNFGLVLSVLAVFGKSIWGVMGQSTWGNSTRSTDCVAIGSSWHFA
jgi:hypothetical protein